MTQDHCHCCRSPLALVTVVSHRRQMKQSPADADNKVLTSLALKYVWSAFTRPDHEYGIMAEEQGLSVEKRSSEMKSVFIVVKAILKTFSLQVVYPVYIIYSGRKTLSCRHCLDCQHDEALIFVFRNIKVAAGAGTKVSWCNFTMLLPAGWSRSSNRGETNLVPGTTSHKH